MGEMNVKFQMAKIRRFEEAFIATHLIAIGDELGIFEALNRDKAGLTVQETASRLDLHEPYLKIWCRTLYYLEVLDRYDHGRFSLQSSLDEIIGDKKNFRNYLANISLDANLVAKGIAEARECFRQKSRLRVYDGPEVAGLASTTTKNIYLAFLFMILPKNEHLQNLLGEGIKFLDDGCGDETLITRLAQSIPNGTFVGVSPDVYGIWSAEAAIAEMGMEERAGVEHQGGEDIVYRDKFHMVSMIVTLNEISQEVRKRVIERAYDAIKPGGFLLILDLPCPSRIENFRSPRYDDGILDQCYEMCIGTEHLTTPQQDELVLQAGSDNLQRMHIGEGMFDSVTATK
ncbi:MAG: class I SAM-dependent methyltransferase [Acidobacteriota bacterium]